MENEEKEITFGKIFKVAFSNWKLFTPVAVGTCVACALGIHFGYNTLKGNYSSTFSYSSADLSQEKYADGSDFFYKNLVSYTNLSNVKASDEKYASIDVDKILDKNGISITADTEEKTYTITLGYKFVKNGTLAKDFIKDLAESALKKDADLVNNGSYDSALKLYDKAETFEEQVTYLNNQAVYLSAQYKELGDVSNSSDTSKDGTDAKKSTISLPTSVTNQITANSQELTLLIPESFVTTMNARIASNGLVKNYSSAEEYAKLEKREADLNAEKLENNARITDWTNKINALDQGTAINTLTVELQKLIVRNQDIDVELAAIANKISKRGVQPSDEYNRLVSDLASYRTKLNDAVNAYRSVLNAAYVDNASVEYEDSSAVVLKGSIGIVINGVISVVVGVVVGAVVNLIVDRKKLYE